MWEISKQFDFCYGHRVWTQELNKEYSLDDKTKCRHLHGHQGTIIVYLQAYGLKNGMVTDFKHLNWFKKWLDDTLDHKFILDKNDPLYKILLPYEHQLHWHQEGHAIPGMAKLSTGPIEELFEGMIIVDFIPTSENITQWLFDILWKKMIKIGVTVTKVEFKETPKSQATFSKD